ncbi:unnamed protein product [Chrysoparadoxa australica]
MEKKQGEEEEDGAAQPLWDQMTTREDKQAAKEAGFRHLSDWQEDRQLKATLAASKAEADMGNNEYDAAFIEAGFQAMAVAYRDAEAEGEQEAEEKKGGEDSVLVAVPESHDEVRQWERNLMQEEEEDLGFFAEADEGFIPFDDGEEIDSEVGARGSSAGSGDHEDSGSELASDKEIEEAYSDVFVSLGDDLARKVMLFLDPDSVAQCGCVCKAWQFPLDEQVFRYLCEQTYLKQSAKKQLNVARWRSWRRMLIHRPRLRTNGIYFLRNSYLKQPVLDMWTTAQPGELLKVTHFRYMRFLPDGTVKYALLCEPPKQALKHFKANNCKILRGNYLVTGNQVNVVVYPHYAKVGFALELKHGIWGGHFATLEMKEHWSAPKNDPSGSRCRHKVQPTDLFRFRRVLEGI